MFQNYRHFKQTIKHVLQLDIKTLTPGVVEY